MRYDESANGSEVDLGAGEEFELLLPETRTAGYIWTVKGSGEPVCTLLDESSQAVTGKVGGSGTHSWRFRAAAPGTGLLALEYRRPWESSLEPGRTFTLKVRVRP